MKYEDISSIIKRYRIDENDINIEGIYHTELKDIENAYNDLRNHSLKLRLVQAEHVYNLIKQYFDKQKLKTIDSGLYKKRKNKRSRKNKKSQRRSRKNKKSQRRSRKNKKVRSKK